MQYIQEPFTLSCHPFFVVMKKISSSLVFLSCVLLVVLLVSYQDVDAAAPWPVNVKGRGVGRLRVKKLNIL